MQIALTDRESDLMDILWESGASTVAEVQKALEDELAYTTVLSVLQTLERKGYVGHQEEGRAHRYRALIDRDAARRSALKHLTAKFFKGSLEQLLLHAVEEHKLSDAEIKRIRSLLDQSSRKKPP
jgi:BlaI family transcriptional regulator, penicillinase repressor